MKQNLVIAQEQLKVGFSFAVENAHELLFSAMLLQEQYPAKALALAQIGQEEVGKSLTILAAFGLPNQPEKWSWFWDGWRDHNLKAHRAYLYELVTPFRLGTSSPDGQVHDGEPRRSPISKEKEVGFYVDCDKGSKKFTSPLESVSVLDCVVRISTLLSLVSIAYAVNQTLTREKPDFRFLEFGKLALRLCSEEIYQQDMPKLFRHLSVVSEDHKKMILDLNSELQARENMIQQMVKDRSKV